MPTSIGRAIRLPFSLPILLASTLLCIYPGNAVHAHAQQSAASASAPRIVEAVDETRLTTLKGNTRPEARAKNDRGPVAANLPMSGLILVLRRSPEQQAAFDAFVAGQYDPKSPHFHQWLTPAQIGTQYGPSLTDIATINSWLTNHGFTVEEVSNDRLNIRFRGNAGLVQSAFHTEIHNLQVTTRAGEVENHIANMSDPQIPSALAPVVVGVQALHNFYPRPLHQVGSVVRRNSDGKWERIGSPAGRSSVASTETRIAKSSTGKSMKLDPLFNTGGTSSGAANIEDLVPYDFATIYNVLPLWNAATAINGSGQTIAIVGTSNINPADVQTFRSAFGLPAYGALTGSTPGISIVIPTGTTDPGDCSTYADSCSGDLTENTLDVEWSGAVAPKANIILVPSSTGTASGYAGDPVYISSNYIVQKKLAPIMNVSYGECELGLGTAGNAAYNSMWQSAAAEGIAVFVATGDSGSASCDAGQETSLPYGAQYGLSVSGVASSQYATAVGGTDFNWAWTNNQSTYWAASNNATTDASALGYIPESPWNSTCSNYLYDQAVNSGLNTSYDAGQICDYIGTGQITTSTGQTLYELVDVAGGGGGPSNCTTVTSTASSYTCSNPYPKPSWQTGVSGIPADGARDIPDVSFFAANGFSGTAYVICVSAASACTFTAGTEPGQGLEIGGTSVASPAMAGVMALINQRAGTSQGNPNAALYALAAKQTYSSCSSESIPLTGSACYFNDIDIGTNAMACDIGSPNCNADSTNTEFGVLSGYSANAGYDLTTGLGSLNVANTVNAIVAAAAPAVTLSPTSLTFLSTPFGSTSAPQVITLTNSGSANLTGIAVSITGTNASSYQETNTCPTTLGPTLTCAIKVVFQPTGFGGQSASISIADNASGSPQTVGLAGLSTETGSYSISASAVSVTAGQSGTSTITATATTNYNASPISIISCTLATSPTGAVNAPTCTPDATPITIANGTGTGAVTITTSAGVAGQFKPVVKKQARPAGKWIAGGGFAAALFLLFGIPAKRRKLFSTLGALMLIASFGVFYGCGGGGGGTIQNEPPPTVVTSTPATAITNTGATIGGTVNPNGSATTASFTYGLSTTALSQTTASKTVGSGTTASSITATLSGLASGTKYFYQATASNTGGSASGSVESFTTGAPATTSGTYTFTVTAADAANVIQTATVTVTVN